MTVFMVVTPYSWVYINNSKNLPKLFQIDDKVGMGRAGSSTFIPTYQKNAVSLMTNMKTVYSTNWTQTACFIVSHSTANVTGCPMGWRILHHKPAVVRVMLKGDHVTWISLLCLGSSNERGTRAAPSNAASDVSCTCGDSREFWNDFSEPQQHPQQHVYRLECWRRYCKCDQAPGSNPGYSGERPCLRGCTKVAVRSTTVVTKQHSTRSIVS